MTRRDPSSDVEGGRRDVSHRAAAGDGDRLREQLLDAAEAGLIAAGSLQGVSLRAVARDVGVSPTAVYLHFRDKDEMIVQVCQRRFLAFAQMLREARASHNDPPSQLRACGQAYVTFGLRHPDQYNVLFGGLPIESVLEYIPEDELAGLQALRELAEIIAEGVSRGDFRDIDPFTAAVSMWATVHGLVGVLSHGSGKREDVPADILVRVALDVALRGLGT